MQLGKVTFGARVINFAPAGHYTVKFEQAISNIAVQRYFGFDNHNGLVDKGIFALFVPFNSHGKGSVMPSFRTHTLPVTLTL